MHAFILWLQQSLTPLRLLVIAFFDSSFLSVPEVNDVLVVTQGAAQPQTAWQFVLAATVGSVLGCSALWWVGKQRGEPYLVRRFGRERVDLTRRRLERWNVLALALPAILPPPLPFKMFVFSSGVFGVPFPRFVLTIAAARGLRYVAWGAIGTWYGPQVLEWVEAHALVITPVFVVLLLGALVVEWRRRTGAPAQ
jgi:membrane protein YqaA with SNARE-associated domain